MPAKSSANRPENATDPDLKSQLLTAMISHVTFDGWSQGAFDLAVADCDMDPALARAICPRGAVDLAAAYHQAGDDQMAKALGDQDLGAMKIRERIAFAVRTRLELADRDVVRRGAALFALPQHAAEGSALIWGTADRIWSTLGDPSRDLNWYSKRAVLSGVYGSTVLFWLGDDSTDHEASWAFLDRRIENVMQFEKTKAQFRKSPLARMLQGPLGMLDHIKAPAARDDLPGRVREH